jgi:hypothetical protein
LRSIFLERGTDQSGKPPASLLLDESRLAVGAPAEATIARRDIVKRVNEAFIAVFWKN